MRRTTYALAVWSWYTPWSGMSGDQLTTLAANVAPNVMMFGAPTGVGFDSGDLARRLPLTANMVTKATRFGIHMKVLYLESP